MRKIHLKKGLMLKIPQLSGSPIFYGTILLSTAEMLPIYEALPSIIRHATFLASVALILLDTLQIKKYSVDFFCTIGLAILINIYAYFQIYASWNFAYYLVQVIRGWLFVMLGVYYSCYGNDNEKKIITYIIVTIAVVTAITSTITVKSYPEAVRALGNADLHAGADVQYLYVRNTANWGILYGNVFLIPTLINKYKRRKAKIWIVVLLIIEFFILSSQVTFGIIFSLMFLIFLFIKPFDAKKMVLFIALFIGTIVLFQNYLDDILYFIRYTILDQFDGLETLKNRIYELYRSVQYGQFVGDGAARLELYSISLNTFLHYPIFGYNANSDVLYHAHVGRHSQILDNMAALGIVGFVPLCVLILSKGKSIYNSINTKESKNYQLLTYIIFGILALVNPVFNTPAVFLSVFLFPTLINTSDAVEIIPSNRS